MRDHDEGPRSTADATLPERIAALVLAKPIREVTPQDVLMVYALELLPRARKRAERVIEHGSDRAFVDLLRELHDRIAGRPTQPISGERGGPIDIRVVHEYAREHAKDQD